MKKYLLSLTAASLLVSPMLFADTSTSDTSTPATTPAGQTQGDPSQAPTTEAAVPDATPTTVATPSSNASTDAALTNVQLKSMSGSIVPAKIDPQDLQGISVGDQLVVTSIGTPTPPDTDTPVTNSSM